MHLASLFIYFILRETYVMLPEARTWDFKKTCKLHSYFEGTKLCNKRTLSKHLPFCGERHRVALAEQYARDINRLGDTSTTIKVSARALTETHAFMSMMTRRSPSICRRECHFPFCASIERHIKFAGINILIITMQSSDCTFSASVELAQGWSGARCRTNFT